MKPVAIEFTNYKVTVADALDQAGLESLLKGQEKVILKPNLVNSSPHPVTTSPLFCEAVAHYVRDRSNTKIIIAEGTGTPSKTTMEIFHERGFTKISKKIDLELLDLNEEPCIKLTKPGLPVFPEIYLPEIVFESFIISLPNLKAHSLAAMTGALKNMVGIAPPAHYAGQYGNWNKAFFHGRMHDSIIDLNRYRSPDFSVMDATIGLTEFHLGGAQIKTNKIIAGKNPLLLDRMASDFLGLDWKTIKHIAEDHYGFGE